MGWGLYLPAKILPMNALVLSAGGMYGAYQVGAWKALADVFSPDLVVGASIGAVNGWAIAGGCDPQALAHRWMTIGNAGRLHWKFPSGIFGGVMDSAPLQTVIRETYEAYRPRTSYALVLTDLLKLQPRIFRGGEITWRHLLATTAIIGIFDQVRIHDRVYSDGGLLSAVPLWAAAELGATKALVINVLPEMPGIVAKTFVRAVRIVSSFRAVVPPSVEVITLEPPRLLGPPLDSLYWKEENTGNWIRQGEQDALAIKHSIVNCFEAK